MSDAQAHPSPIKLRWFFGIFAAFLIFVVIAALSSRLAKDGPSYDAEEGAERVATLKKLQAEDEKTLTTADWIDQTKGTVRIPIDEAIPKEVEALKGKPAQIGAEIPGAVPAPPPVAKTAAPATNAVPAAPSAHAASKK